MPHSFHVNGDTYALLYSYIIYLASNCLKTNLNYIEQVINFSEFLHSLNLVALLFNFVGICGRYIKTRYTVYYMYT